MFMTDCNSKGRKQVYYLSMEFLMGRSLKTNLYNLGMQDEVAKALKKLDVKIEHIYEEEPDAGLGNGGLGRLAACYLDGLATCAFPATGYSILYEYGIFKQKIIDGWQTELPDDWLPGGRAWLVPVPDQAIEVHFDGEIYEKWEQNYHSVNHVNYKTVNAVPYDMYVSGYDSKGVSKLRLWSAESMSFDMNMFNQGDYAKAIGANNIAHSLTKVLYPNDNHLEGKALRLRQQYFMSAASVGDIVMRHMNVYGTLENLHEKVAIHINDTHPTLAIPELMRILLDDCGYDWDKAWNIITNTFDYTNHTVMAEALETWDVDLMQRILPRIYAIIVEINNRYCAHLTEVTGGDSEKVTRMSIILDNRVKMANLCCAASSSVNGVSKLHSEIIKDSVFHDQYTVNPDAFKNVTNGIAYRRWLLASNQGLTNLLTECIGDGFKKDASKLADFKKFATDKSVLDKLAAVKLANKQAFAKYVYNTTGTKLNCNGIFDVQVKRLHEYKRQLLNAFSILYLYYEIKDGNLRDFTPTTFIFGAKSAPGYYRAKGIIKFINEVAKLVNSDPDTKNLLRVVFVSNYRVSYAEKLVAAADISEQISTAGTEASGTGNMKFMLNGAVTLGTLDGANVEIAEEAGAENEYIFGATVEELEKIMPHYVPRDITESDPKIKRVVSALIDGTVSDGGSGVFRELYFALMEGASWHVPDHYYLLGDLDSYVKAKLTVNRDYSNELAFAKKCWLNICSAGKFSSDRTIAEYAKDIWHIGKV